MHHVTDMSYNITLLTLQRSERPHLTTGAFLFTLLILLLMAGCRPEQAAEHESMAEMVYPLIQEGGDTVVYADAVRRFVASHSDRGLLPNTYCDTFGRVAIEDFEVGRYLELFERDEGTATCGLSAMMMVRILMNSGIDAYTYNFGFKDSHLTHVVVLVKVNRRLLVFDPYMNYALLDSSGQNMDLVRLLRDIGRDALNTAFSADTVKAEMVVDHRLMNTAQSDLYESPECGHWRQTAVEIRDSVYKHPVMRCFPCEAEETCHSFVRNFEAKLKTETRFTEFHQGLALKINQTYGAPDHAEVNAYIDSVIAHTPGLAQPD